MNLSESASSINLIVFWFQKVGTFWIKRRSVLPLMWWKRSCDFTVKTSPLIRTPTGVAISPFRWWVHSWIFIEPYNHALYVCFWYVNYNQKSIVKIFLMSTIDTGLSSNFISPTHLAYQDMDIFKVFFHW